MNRYPSYKPSGVKWLGEIPSHWDCVKLKSLCKMYGRIGFRGYSREDLVDEGEGAITLSPSNFVEGHLDYSKCSYLSWKKYYESPEIMVQNGDIVFVKTASIGKVALVRDLPLKTTINPQILVFKNLNCNASYLNYYLQTSMLQGWILASANGSTIYTISQVEVGNYPIFLPPLDEQSAIAAYLDTATAKIDAAIAQQQKMIDLLNERKQIIINRAVTKGLNPNAKMKDSGVEWIGEVPEGWEIRRLKRLVGVSDGTHDTPLYVEPSSNTYPLITSRCIVNGEIIMELANHISYADYFEISKRSYVQKYDVIMPMIGTVGNPAIVMTNGEFAIKNVALFRTYGSYNLAKLLVYLLNSRIVKDQLSFLFKGGVQNFVSQEILKNLILVIPDNIESILSHIDSRILKIDKVIDNCKRQISLLQERKQIIINEVVTGKVRVV